MRKHGVTGYGLFWMFIEDLYNNANALPTDYEGIAYEYRVDENLVKSLINDFGFFEIKNGYFGSISVQKRIEERDAKSEKARKSAFARWDKTEEEPKEDANAMQTQSDSNAIKNSIEEDSIDKKGKIDFEFVWDLYDKKKGDIGKLKIKWDKLSFSIQQLIIEHIPKYKKEQPEKQFRKNFETYLNNKSYNDEIITNETNKPSSSVHDADYYDTFESALSKP